MKTLHKFVVTVMIMASLVACGDGGGDVLTSINDDVQQKTAFVEQTIDGIEAAKDTPISFDVCWEGGC